MFKLFGPKKQPENSELVQQLIDKIIKMLENNYQFEVSLMGNLYSKEKHIDIFLPIGYLYGAIRINGIEFCIKDFGKLEAAINNWKNNRKQLVIEKFLKEN